jgi:hypothetical protein
MKKINLTIGSCKECPYCHYNGHYDRNRDSGYDCSETMKRIVDDWDVANDNNPNPAGWPDIPDWCPLENSP